MKLTSRVILTAAVAALACPASRADTRFPNIADIIKHYDQMYRSESSYAQIEMEIVTAHWQRTLDMHAWSEGTEKTFIRINSPRKERGVGTLRIGNEMWNYLPKVNKVIKIPPSMMMSSWMGSDFSNDDLVSEISLYDDYTYEYVRVDAPEEGLLYIKAVPNDGVPVVWGHIIMAIRASDYLPVWETYHDDRGRVMRTLRFSDIREFGKHTLPATLEMIPGNKEGNKTVIRYIHLEFDLVLEPDIFSLRNLRSPK